MDLVTWNVNSLRSRLDRVVAWLEQHKPDVVCLQETKCPDEQFPTAELDAVGYRAAYTGEKGLNGVAILAREPLEGVVTVLPGREDDAQRRFIAARVGGVQVMNVYVPNGQAVASDAFFFKLDWLSRLQRHLVESHDPAGELVLVGDFNIAPGDRDVYDPVAWKDRLHCTAHERRMIQHLLSWGFVDALREVHPDAPLYSWFDYRASDVKNNKGLRIDLILVTRAVADRLQDVRIDLEERQGERPSDHAPVVATFGAR